MKYGFSEDSIEVYKALTNPFSLPFDGASIGDESEGRFDRAASWRAMMSWLFPLRHNAVDTSIECFNQKSKDNGESDEAQP